jgi:hypothetical protein
MVDAKLLTEISHAFLYGISTTSKRSLDDLYKGRDKEFPEEIEVERRLSIALDQLIAWRDIHNTALMKAHVVYSLILALMYVREPVTTLEKHFSSPRLEEFDESSVIANLTALAAALDNADDAGELSPFVEASSERTNVIDQRTTRFVWFCRALTEPSL